MSPGISGGWFSLKLNFSPGLSGQAGLKLSSATVPEPRPHPEKVLFDLCLLVWCSQPEECVIFHCTFPQVFTTFLSGQPAKLRIEFEKISLQ